MYVVLFWVVGLLLCLGLFVGCGVDGCMVV